MVLVERLGRLRSVHSGGLFWAIPLIDRLRLRIDTRETALSYAPLTATTRDGFCVSVLGTLYIHVTDAERACYATANPLAAALLVSRTAAAAIVGEHTLSEVLQGREELSAAIRDTVAGRALMWGLQVTRHELTDVSPDEDAVAGLRAIAASRLSAQERIIRAEAERDAAVIEAESERIRSTARNETVRLAKEAEAEAAAAAVRYHAESHARALHVLADALNAENGRAAARLALTPAGESGPHDEERSGLEALWGFLEAAP